MKKIIVAAVAALMVMGLMTGCGGTPQPKYTNITPAQEAEYKPYVKQGTSRLSGQAFSVQAGGGVVPAAGRTITLVPATSIGKRWWLSLDRGYQSSYRLERDNAITPPSVNFKKTRRTTIADMDGNFEFTGLPNGRYYVRTKITWLAGNYKTGGNVGRMVLVNGNTKVIISKFDR